MYSRLSFRHRGAEGVSKMQYLNEEDAQVTVSFQLTAHDWYLLQKKPEWVLVEKWILETQKGSMQDI